MISLSLDFFALDDQAENMNDNTALNQECKAFHRIFSDFFSDCFYCHQFLHHMKLAVVADFTQTRKLPIHNGDLRLHIEGIENEGLVGDNYMHVFTPVMLRNFFARRCRHSRIKGKE
jgi:hypothetical protein